MVKEGKDGVLYRSELARSGRAREEGKYRWYKIVPAVEVKPERTFETPDVAAYRAIFQGGEELDSTLRRDFEQTAVDQGHYGEDVMGVNTDPSAIFGAEAAAPPSLQNSGEASAHQSLLSAKFRRGWDLARFTKGPAINETIRSKLGETMGRTIISFPPPTGICSRPYSLQHGRRSDLG